jgi:hypothetical protein
MSLHILIGHEKPGQRGHAEALYIGPSGVDLQAAKAKATCGSFTILSNPQGQRKSNPAYNPEASFSVVNHVNPVAPAPVEIPDDISGLKKPELVQAMVSAVARIKQLEALVQSLRQPDQQQSQDLTMSGSADDQQPQDHTIPGSPDDLLQK